MGGFQAVTNALERLVTDLDVDIRCDTTVTGVTNDGVWLQSSTNHGDDTVVDNEFISADLIIVNADLPYAKKSLLIDNNNTDDSNDSSANKNKNIYIGNGVK